MDYSKVNTLKLDGTNKIISVLSKHTGIAANVTSFQTALEQLNANQKKLVDYYSLLGKDTLTIENAKDDQRKGLLKTILPVITMMQIFAYDKKKKNLLKRLESLTPEYLQNCSDIELINLSKKVWLTANKYGIYSLAFINKIKSSLKSNRSKAILKLEKEYGFLLEWNKSKRNGCSTRNL